MGNILNVYEQVDVNKQKSWLIVFGFIGFVVGFVWLAGEVLGADPGLIVLAVIFSLFSSVTSFFWGDKIILGLSRAKPASKKKHFNFYTAVENLSIAAQIPLPKLYVIDSPAMNAFAAGRDPNHAVVCVTTGLLNKLKKTELEGVIAHEISHIVNFDIRLMMIVAILVGMVTLLSHWLLRTSQITGGDRNRRGSSFILLAVGFLMIVFSPIVAKLIQLAISRRREFLADASAVKLTRQPQGLANALKKLSQGPPLKTANPATAHLYIVSPVKTLFSTHPPIEKRVAALEKML